MRQSWINGILALWVIVSGFIPATQDSVNYIILGALIAALGFWAFQRWQNWVSGIIGLWFILSGIFTGLIGPANSIIGGVIVAALSFWAGATGKSLATTAKTT